LEKLAATASSSTTAIDLTPANPESGSPLVAELLPSDDNDDAAGDSHDKSKRVVIDPVHDRFFGNSSATTLIRSAMDLKKKYTGNGDSVSTSLPASEKPDAWNTSPVRCHPLF